MSLLITLEGLDAMGKSTLAEALVKALSQDACFQSDVLGTKEPGSNWTSAGPELRKLVLESPDFEPIERELLFYVDASMHSRFIQKQQQAVIISDRGLWSHLAYVRGYLKTGQMDYTDYETCKSLISRVCAEPDCVVYIKGSLDLMKERLAGKKKDVIESNGDEFYNVVIETYQDLAVDREWAGKPLITLDASDSLDNNIMKVVDYLKEVFTNEQITNGNREVCSI